MEDIRVLAFFYIEQAALMSFLGMGLIGIRLHWKEIVSIAILQGLVVYLSRSILCNVYGFPFGTHSLLSFISLVILFHVICKKGVGISLTATVIGFIAVLLSEGIFGLIFLHSSSALTVDRLYQNVWIHIGYSYIASWLLLLTVVYLYIFKKPLINIETRNRKV